MVIGFLPLMLFWFGLPQLASITAYIFGRIVIIPIQILMHHERSSEYFEQMHPKLCHVLKTMWYSVKPPNAVDPSSHESSNDQPSEPATSGAGLPKPGLIKPSEQTKTFDRQDTQPRLQDEDGLPQPGLAKNEEQKIMERKVTHPRIKPEDRRLPQTDSYPIKSNNMAINAQQQIWPKPSTSREMTRIQID